MKVKKILIIEDEAPFREAIVFALEEEGHQVLQAENGAEGIRLARKHVPDLILSDVMMDSVDGYEALVALRQDQRTSEIPIILMTGKTDKEGLVHAIELGADDYLTKPFTIPELLEAIGIRFKKQEDQRRRVKEQSSDPRSFLTLGIPGDLRTPIAGILGFSKALTREYVEMNQSEIHELGRAIQKAARNLLRLAENYSILAQIEILEREPEKVRSLRSLRTTDLKGAIEPIALDLAHHYERSPDLVMMIGNAPVACSQEYIGKIMFELVDNAMKFSSKEQKIQVSALPEPNRVAMIVTDFGHGMTREQIGDIQSYSGLSSRLTDDRHFGWGLVVAKKLSELHGGNLSLASAGAGGMMAKVTLPLASR